MKNSILFNDISGLGRCSLSVQLPIISTMKITTCPVPTGVFSCQSGFPKFHYTNLADQVKQTIDDLVDMNVFFDGILAGFMMNENQLLILEDYLKHPRNAKTLVLIDPILGDNGKQFSFFPTGYLKKMQETIKLATVITPNLTELCLLSNTSYEDLLKYSKLPIKEYLDHISSLAKGLLNDNLKTVIVTGIHQTDEIGKTTVHNLLVNHRTDGFTSEEFKLGNFSGTGDILSAMMFAYLMNDIEEMEALQKTSDFLQRVISKSETNHIDGKFGTDFEPELKNIIL